MTTTSPQSPVRHAVLDAPLQALRTLEPRRIVGSVAAVRGLSVLVDDLPLPVGALVRIEQRIRNPRETDMWGEIIGFDGAQSIIMLFGASSGIAPGSRVIGEQSAQTAHVGSRMLGRVLNAMGRPVDGGPNIADTMARPLTPPPLPAMQRCTITDPLPTGVRVVDGMLTLGRGQRVGVFSGPGVGKSTLLASIARNTAADVNVIALVGERGREVRDFIEHALGEEGLARSVVIVATGDESPLLRVRAALLASAVAEHFRDQAMDVMLIMDSVTRLAQAQRQIGLNMGEQPATRGYTPSVFALLPSLLERAGSIALPGGARGSITGIYSVLVEGDDINEPVSDAVRGILDGHIALSRRLAGQGHFPAVDVRESISRVADAVCDAHHVQARRMLLRLLSAYAESEELIRIDAYAPGSDVYCDVAIRMKDKLDAFLQQPTVDAADYPRTCRTMIELAAEAEQLTQQLRAAAAQGARGGTK